MNHAHRILTLVAIALVMALASCGGGEDKVTSGDPLVDAFASQLALDAGYPWFQAFDQAETECFAATALHTISQQRQTELRFAADNIPLLTEADWTDTEIDALTDILDGCVDDNTTGTEAFVLSAYGGLDRYGNCMVPEITTTLGERYWLEAFRAGFTPPRIDMINAEADLQAQIAGEELGWLPSSAETYQDLQPIFETCAVPGRSESGGPVIYAEDACGGEPCEDEPEPTGFGALALECSRDPYVYAGGYFGTTRFRDWIPSPSACEEQRLGTLISVMLLAYPCPQGPREMQIRTTGEPITEAMVTDACGSSPPAEGPTPTVDSDLRSLDEPWDAEAFTSPLPLTKVSGFLAGPWSSSMACSCWLTTMRSEWPMARQS